MKAVAIYDIRLKQILLSFAHDVFPSYPIVWKFAEHVSDTYVLCAKFQNDSTTDMDVMEEWCLARFQWKMRFGRISYRVTVPTCRCQEGPLGTKDFCGDKAIKLQNIAKWQDGL